MADADWAGLAERRSVTGGVVLLAGCCMASWSRTPASYALSSCESELYAMGSPAVEVLGVHAFLVEQGPLERAACRLGRQFVGSAVGIQSWVLMERLRLQKVLSADNVADVLTKHVSRNTWETLCASLGLRTSV